MLGELFVLVTLTCLVMVTPGPDMMLVLRNTVLGGRRAGLCPVRFVQLCVDLLFDFPIQALEVRRRSTRKKIASHAFHPHSVCGWRD